ncbi:MAG: hypothetical protein RIS41_273 [Actinomycetota bacterium]|jgi:very-short-patch-repair endonuclease
MGRGGDGAKVPTPPRPSRLCPLSAHPEAQRAVCEFCASEWELPPGCAKSHMDSVNRTFAALTQIADQRGGLVLLEDFERLGISRSTRQRLVADGVVRRVHRGTVFALGRSPLDIRAEIAGACWAVPGSWASGNTAAEYWGIRRIPRGRVEVSVQSDRCPRLSGVRVRRTNLMEPDVIHLVGGGIVSSPAQTLFEISHETDDRTLLSAFEDCVNRDLATVAEIRAFGSRVIKMGRPGSARFRRVILGRPDELPFAMSHPELVLAKALEADDSRWRRQHRLLLPGGTAAYIDVARPEIKLGVEVDGAVHESPLAIASDKRRDVMAAQIGWHILRCTTDDVQSHLRSLVAQILEAAKARQSQFPGPRT